MSLSSSEINSAKIDWLRKVEGKVGKNVKKFKGGRVKTWKLRQIYMKGQKLGVQFYYLEIPYGKVWEPSLLSPRG